MARLIVARAAHADMLAILSYLGRVAGIPTVREYRDLFLGLYDRLATHPASGALAAGLESDIRTGVVRRYIVIYRYAEEQDVVTILGIVHGRRKISGKLLALGR